MKYSGKKLPSGFMYMLNKKDLKDIEDIVAHPIESVYLDGTSYSETKMAKFWLNKTENVHFSVGYIKYIKEETSLKIEIQLYGIRKSHFKDLESILSHKEKIKNDMIEKIRKGIDLYSNNLLDFEYKFVSIHLN